MPVQITTIPLGPTNCYILKEDKTILIDTGGPKKADRFVGECRKRSVDPEEISLIVITHGHWDHIGSARDIKEITGAKLAMHRDEREWLEKALMKMPPGVTTVGKLLTALGSVTSRFIDFPAASVDVELGSEEFALADYGISGSVIPTPGHTQGSVSVLLETGEAFVGDLCMTMFPLKQGPGLPVFADDMDQVKDSLRRLQSRGMTTIYPSHGKPIPAEALRNAL